MVGAGMVVLGCSCCCEEGGGGEGCGGGDSGITRAQSSLPLR